MQHDAKELTEYRRKLISVPSFEGLTPEEEAEIAQIAASTSDPSDDDEDIDVNTEPNFVSQKLLSPVRKPVGQSHFQEQRGSTNIVIQVNTDQVKARPSSLFGP